MSLFGGFGGQNAGGYGGAFGDSVPTGQGTLKYAKNPDGSYVRNAQGQYAIDPGEGIPFQWTGKNPEYGEYTGTPMGTLPGPDGLFQDNRQTFGQQTGQNVTWTDDKGVVRFGDAPRTSTPDPTVPEWNKNVNSWLTTSPLGRIIAPILSSGAIGVSYGLGPGNPGGSPLSAADINSRVTDAVEKYRRDNPSVQFAQPDIDMLGAITGGQFSLDPRSIQPTNSVGESRINLTGTEPNKVGTTPIDIGGPVRDLHGLWQDYHYNPTEQNRLALANHPDWAGSGLPGAPPKGEGQPSTPAAPGSPAAAVGAGTTAAGAAGATGAGLGGLGDLLVPGGIALSTLLSSLAAYSGGKDQAEAIKHAADKEAEAAAAALGLQKEQFTALMKREREIYDTSRADTLPYRNAGQQALGEIQGFDNTNPNFSMQQFNQDPGYAFRLSEGLKAMENSAASKGLLRSGNTMKGLNNYAQESASQEYGNAFNRYQTERGAKLNRLQSLAGLGQSGVQQANNAGQNYANSMGQAGQNYANNAGQLGMNAASSVGQGLTGAAAANTSGYMGAANAFTSGLGNLMSYYQNQQGQNLLAKMLGK